MRTTKDSLQQRAWAWIQEFIVRRQTVYVAIIIGLLIGIIVQLSLVPSGASQTEIHTYNDVSSISAITNNPTYLAYKIPGYVMSQFSSSVRAMRALSIVFYSICIVALYRILKRWHSSRTALLTLAIFATNATVLGVARLASTQVMLLSWVIIISLLLWLVHGKSRNASPFSLGVIGALLFYTPGAPYFFVLLLFMYSKKYRGLFKKLPLKTKLLAFIVSIAAITPLIISFIRDSEVLQQWLLIPDTIGWSSLFQNILRVPSAFFFRSPVDPTITVGSLPILDLATAGLFLIGVYVYWRNFRLERTKIILSICAFSLVAGAMGQTMFAVIILLPFVYAVIASGVSCLLDEWYARFPKNPFARIFGATILIILLSVITYYQLTRSLVVFPQTPETRQEFNSPRLIQ